MPSRSRRRPTSPAARRTDAVPARAASPSGAFGSDVTGNLTRTAVAELIGTFLLVLVGTSVATRSFGDETLYAPGFIALAFGLALTALVAGLGHISGCHVNPAVTIGLAVAGTFPWRYVPAYVGAQFTGGVLASLCLWASYGDAARGGDGRLGTTAPTAGTSLSQALLVEAVITFLLVFVVCSVATDERVPKAAAPIAVGFALAAAVFVGLPATGGAVNPARAFGPMLVSGTFDSWWTYLLGPVLGGVLGALAYHKAVRPAAAPQG